MLTMTITDDVRREALWLCRGIEDRYKRNADSIRAGEGHYYAKIAEVMVARHFGLHHANTFDYDLIDIAGHRIDVKVKRRAVPPRARYLASVASANTTQECDYYLFCSTLGDDQLFVIGNIPKDKFFALAIFRKQGEPDPDSPLGQDWTFRADCHNLPYSCLPAIGKEPLL